MSHVIHLARIGGVASLVASLASHPSADVIIDWSQRADD